MSDTNERGHYLSKGSEAMTTPDTVDSVVAEMREHARAMTQRGLDGAGAMALAASRIEAAHRHAIAHALREPTAEEMLAVVGPAWNGTISPTTTGIIAQRRREANLE